MPVASGLTASSGRFKSNLVQYNVEKSNKYIVFAVFSLHVAPESHLSHHATSMHGIALARRARPWILYGPSEQSRWAPQLGQRSWQACMSIIVCPHMGHSFFLPAVIYHAPGSASYYSYWQARYPWQRSSTHARACARVAACLPGSQTHAAATTPRSGGTKICTK